MLTVRMTQKLRKVCDVDVVEPASVFCHVAEANSGAIRVLLSKPCFEFGAALADAALRARMPPITRQCLNY